LKPVWISFPDLQLLKKETPVVFPYNCHKAKKIEARRMISDAIFLNSILGIIFFLCKGKQNFEVLGFF
jgi:hypothetical protein